MNQTSAQTALAPFLALAKSATSARAASDLVTQATSAPGSYIFAELLAQKNIENLKADSQYAGYHRLLEIFSWGTWETYKTTTGLPKLSDAQTLKLRLLSLITYASEQRGDLSYGALCERLDFDSAVQLEHLVTTAIYSDLLTATLNPAEQTVLISSVAPLRDVTPGSVTKMLEELEAWSARCQNVLSELDMEITAIKTAALKKSTTQAQTEKHFKTALESEKAPSTQREGRGPRGSSKREAAATPDEDFDDEDPMDIDGQTGGPRKRSGGPFDKLRGKS